VDLQILYEDDCFTTPQRNPLCLPFIPTSWTIPFLNLTDVILTNNLANNPDCLSYWHPTTCVFCTRPLVQDLLTTPRFGRISQFYRRVSLPGLLVGPGQPRVDLRYILVCHPVSNKRLGIFVPVPSELLATLGERFPPINWLVKIILLLPPGKQPSGEQWACWFEYSFYLMLGFDGALCIYYCWPLLLWLGEDIIIGYDIYLTFNASLVWRRQAMENYDEALLSTAHAEVQTLQARRARTMLFQNGPRPKPPDSSSLMPRIGDEIALEMEPLVRPPKPAPRKRPLTPEGQLYEIQKIQFESANQDRYEQLVEQCNRLAEMLGAAPAADEMNPALQGRRARIWDRVTSALQIPMQLTPAYLHDLRKFRTRLRKNTPPPESGLYLKDRQTK
jgi:hypothetical protein